ncbi:MAG: hypothetical protein AB4058_04075 [Microcystaceae cyanobacterium]
MAFTVTTLYIVVFDLILAGFLLESLRRVGAKPKFRFSLGVIFGVWLILLHFLISGQKLFPANINSIAFLAAIVLGVAIVGVGCFATPLRSYLLAIPQEYILLIQGLRVFFGAGFLVEASLGVMPVYFGIADGATHILAAFFALKAGLLFAKHGNNQGEIWFANIFGLVDILLVASGLAFFLLSQVGPHHNVMYAALFAAPIFINLHLVSMLKLLKTNQESYPEYSPTIDSQKVSSND